LQNHKKETGKLLSGLINLSFATVVCGKIISEKENINEEIS